jgi:hypothetical protein
MQYLVVNELESYLLRATPPYRRVTECTLVRLMPKILQEILQQGNVAHHGGQADGIPAVATVPVFGLWEALDERFESLKTIVRDRGGS